ncbi:MAG TPA: N(4)-(beta-N-acetylglucosaminyl)-L-asparaginase [Saprospiraceae bacterium]|nr:N(4)-(beta-N-acetylglucosaminyl)-L-asparaginase [Saprospiraceae bacterium]
MHTRRTVLKWGFTSPLYFLSWKDILNSDSSMKQDQSKLKPIVLSTWSSGLAANEAAWQILVNEGIALDAVETGVKVIEADPSNLTVGIGALPDREGIITLDACIMDGNGNAGSVLYLEDFRHPVSIARKIMEETPHVILAGSGAHQFAVEQGFIPEDLHTEVSRSRYENWKLNSKYEPKVNVERHDTIGMIAMDHQGNLSGACTTSGMAFKMRGRVGDSPIIGSGLYVDNEVGAACASGLGEEILKVAGSAMVVELMRNGYSPGDACQEVVARVKRKNNDIKDKQVCFIALNTRGDYGSFAMYAGFDYAVRHSQINEVLPSNYFLELPE